MTISEKYNFIIPLINCGIFRAPYAPTLVGLRKFGATALLAAIAAPVLAVGDAARPPGPRKRPK